ncbi:MAG: TonB-dependent receptor domain-containing protein [Gammaproteobacteria bacterium]
MSLAVASACLAIAMPGHAQEAPAASSDSGAAPAAADASPAPSAVVTVSGSRISSRGFTQPTPTTTLSAADLEKVAKPNLFNAIVEMPALQGSTGRTTSTNSTSSGIQGLSSLSLRGLQPIRTLTLLDGQRVVPANVTGVTDVSQFPQLLVKRVDVVTGGASASYGSDAVGGVVNFITDTRFKGFKANLEGGMTTYHDDKTGTAQAAWGDSFLGDRLHVVASAEYTREKGVPSPGFGEVGANGRSWYQNPAFQVRPIGQTNDGKPQITAISHAQQNQYAKYGLITEGPLKGTAFGDNGAPYQFQYGTNCVGAICQGGDLSGSVGAGTNLGMDMSRKVGYGRVGFDLNPDTEIYVTANLARVTSAFSPNPGMARQNDITVQCSNPFLPASIVAACAQNNITSFKYGTANANLPENTNVHPEREQRRVVAGINGRFDAAGTSWSYNGYLEHGTNKIDIQVNDMTLVPRYNAAIQAVRAADGSIVCANAQAVGCKPLNIFGNVPIDPAALAYIQPATGPHQASTQHQKVASFNVSGEPFESWAGPVGVAFGAEWRKEDYVVAGDPYGNGINSGVGYNSVYPEDPLLSTAANPGNANGNNWYAGNYHSGSGAYSVKEAYVEANIPVLKSATLGEASVNLAGRKTDYSTSGLVNAWKAGVTWKTGLDGWRLRAVTSQDVRAPNLSELFAAPVIVNTAVNFQGTQYTVQQRTVGNANLKPEIARNTTFGIVLTQPAWAPNFSASVDYYDIKVRDVISTLNVQQEADLCAAGNQEICGAISVNKPGSPNYVVLQAFNLASWRTKGVDYEAAYRSNLPLLGNAGKLTVRALATHTITFLQNSGVVNTIPSELAGMNLGNVPRWKVHFSQSWDNDKVSLTLAERWVSSGKYSNEYIECQTGCPVSTPQHQTIFDNHMKGAFYWDIGASYKFSNNLTAFVKVDNVGNTDPVAAPQNNLSYGINPALYDVLGRTYRAGVRYSF